DYAFKFVPREKLSLGIPLYGYHWFAGAPTKAPPQPGFPATDKPNPSAEYIATDDAMDLARAYGGRVEWDPTDRSSWFFFYRDDLREWIFSPTRTPSASAIRWSKTAACRGFAPGFSGRKTLPSGIFCLPTSEGSQYVLVSVA